MSGENSTLILRPEGLSAITFDMAVTSGASGYVADAGSLRLGEHQRLAIAYSESYRDGGEVAASRGALVSVSFDVVVSDTSRAGMLDKAKALIEAVVNANGGTLEYKPDGAGAGVESTFYHYLQSGVPAVKAVRPNRWDAASKADEAFRIVLSVELMTLPFATSDPSSPTSVLGATTLYNVGDGSADFATVVEANVKGTHPALARIYVAPQTSGSSPPIGSLWLAKRSKGLTNFDATYLTSAAVAPSAVWGTETDSGRCGGAYYRCTAAQNDVVYARRYTIANWTDHKGRAAIAIVARQNGQGPNDWEVYFRWTISNYPVEGEAKKLQTTGYWEVLLLGELDLPSTEVSDATDMTLYLDICVVRRQGNGTFDLDAVKLLYTDEAAMQLDMPAGVGCGNTSKMFLENFDEEIAHSILAADGKLQYLLNAYGNFMTLEPGGNTRLDVIWERYTPSAIEDAFDAYSYFYRLVATCDQGEIWENAENLYLPGSSVGVAYYAVHNEQMKKITDVTDPAEVALDESFADFIDDDFFTGYIYMYWDSGGGEQGPTSDVTIQIGLECGASGGPRYHFNTVIGTTQGLKVCSIQKDSFTESGDVNWGRIVNLTVTASTAGDFRDTQIWVDNFRWSRQDPDDSSERNETGGAWDFTGGEWDILAAYGETLALRQNDYESGAGVCYAKLDQVVPQDVEIKIRVNHDQNNGEGIIFRATDFTTSSEDYYFYERTGNQVALWTYVAGSPTNLDYAGHPYNARDWLWLGVRLVGTSIECFVSDSEEDLFSLARRAFKVTNSNHSGSDFALRTDASAHAAFVDLSIQELRERHIPADSLQLAISALFRTVLPFSE